VTELEYLDANPFLTELKDGAGNVKIRVRIRRCPQDGGCGDHPIIEVAHNDEPIDTSPFLPIETVSACFKFVALLATNGISAEDAELAEASWGLMETVLSYRRVMLSAVHRSNLN